MNQVAAFAQRNALGDITGLLQKGALVAQNPRNYQSVPGITDYECEQLEREVTHRWSHPRTMYLTIVLCSVGAAVQGWDQEGSNGANLSWPTQFGVSDAVGAPNAANNGWLIGLVNGAPYLASTCLGCWRKFASRE
jgi:hypothetical protein